MSSGGPSQVRRRERRAAARAAAPPIPKTAKLSVRSALVASGDLPTVAPTYELTQGSLSEMHFYSLVVEAGYTETRHDHWPCDISSLAVGGDFPVSFRAGDRDVVYRLKDGTLAHVRLAWDMLHITVAGPSVETVETMCFAMRDTYPASYMTDEEDTRVPITFWSYGQFGPVPRLRKIEAASWDDIDQNYTADVKTELADLMAWQEPESDGQLLLWQGPPGTGKTWALRALASEWSSWAEFHYITDPDAFFVTNPPYMVDVLLSDSYMAIERASGDVFEETDPQSKWRVLILEDTGELLSANAKEQYGQGLSRLLNVVDGMIGQGLRVLALVTTNDELGDLHPAVARPGRCASQIEFGALNAEEASAWLGETTDEGGTVAELYARSHSGVEALAVDEPYTGTCACGDTADGHAGSMNDGACSIDGCDCTGFQPMTASETASASGTSGTYDFDQANMVFTFTSVDGVPVSYPVTQNGIEFTGVGGFTTVTVDDEDFAGATNPDMPDAHQSQETLPPVRPHPPAPPGGDAKPKAGGAAETGGLDDATEETTPEDQNQEEDVVASNQGVTGMRWTAMIAPEGVPTDDGRIFAPGAVSWRELPLSLGVMMDTPHADVVTASPVCGRIDRIYRSGNLIMAEGEFDNSELGSDIARMVSDGTLRGVSVDLAIAKMEIAYKADILDDNGEWKGGDSPAEGEGPDMLDILFGDSTDDVMFVIWEGTIGAVTICPFPAFADAKIESAKSLVAASNPMVWTVTMQHGMVVVASAVPEPVEALVASATLAEDVTVIPVAPSRDCFENPNFDGPTALTVEGNRVFGHAAIWGVCHIGIPGVCTTAPSSHSGYAYFHLKEVECDDGEPVPCGTITLDTGHADRRLGRLETTRHYDDTGTAVADIVVGEDDYGIWFSGALRSDVTEETLRKLRGAVLSGDWRAANIANDLELVALLAVNVPGFPVPRTRAMVASGADGPHVLALVAAGINDGTVEPMSRVEEAQFEALGDLVAGKFADLAARAQEAAG